MKEPWCLATSLAARTASDVVKLYGKRFTIEETFRDAKDIRFGMGLSATHIRDAGRRDRLLLLAAIAHALLTWLGAASMDRYLKVNTSKERTHSLFRQGAYWYGAILNMRDDWLKNSWSRSTSSSPSMPSARSRAHMRGWLRYAVFWLGPTSERRIRVLHEVDELLP